ncbi:response regulator [Paenibacillus provencensis]|uniref:Response regulator n=1 Tax=Paenibacillus provencensis TaxID=441151 RepID=A0ABW3PWM4_9BACL|nr:response regulator [Paenibacillus sp. MER 78]MCM3128011.1 response regulator [Paenibacillus sp. MER 78]
MFKMLIADDEQIERSALRMIVERNLPDVEVVGEAENGRMAIEMAQRLLPDLVTMDIKMPGTDGIEAVSVLYNLLPDMKVIMVSAFDEFEYARCVMKYGVKEYLLKPCKKEQIVSAIKAVMKDIDEERRELSQMNALRHQAEQTKALLEIDWVSSICQSRTLGAELTEWQQAAGIPADSAGYACVLKVAVDQESGQAELTRIQQWARNRISVYGFCHAGPFIGQHLPLLLFPERLRNESGISVRSRAAHLTRSLLQEAQRMFPSSGMTAGIGTLKFSREGWMRSYHEAVLASSEPRFFCSCFYEDLPAGNEESYPYPHACEQQLLLMIGRGNVEEAKGMFQQYLNELLEMTRYQLARVQHDLHKLFAQILNQAKEKGISLPKLGGFQDINDVEDLRGHAIFQFDIVLEALDTWYMDEHRGSIEKAKAYIAEHYSRELSLEEVADIAGLNPHYFSKIFHERCGITFIDYLTGIRIEKARELLGDPSHILKDISQRIGYRDPNYFSRVFKKMVGMSPSDYRSAALKEC